MSCRQAQGLIDHTFFAGGRIRDDVARASSELSLWLGLRLGQASAYLEPPFLSCWKPHGNGAAFPVLVTRFLCSYVALLFIMYTSVLLSRTRYFRRRLLSSWPWSGHLVVYYIGVYCSTSRRNTCVVYS